MNHWTYVRGTGLHGGNYGKLLIMYVREPPDVRTRHRITRRELWEVVNNVRACTTGRTYVALAYTAGIMGSR